MPWDLLGGVGLLGLLSILTGLLFGWLLGAKDDISPNDDGPESPAEGSRPISNTPITRVTLW